MCVCVCTICGDPTLTPQIREAGVLKFGERRDGEKGDGWIYCRFHGGISIFGKEGRWWVVVVVVLEVRCEDGLKASSMRSVALGGSFVLLAIVYGTVRS